MIWDLSVQPQHAQEISQLWQEVERTLTSTTKEITAANPPLRRILSRATLATYQRPDSQPTPPSPATFPAVQRKGSRQSLTPSPLRNGNAVATTPPFIYRRRSSVASSGDGDRNPPSPLSPGSKTSKRQHAPPPSPSASYSRPRRLSEVPRKDSNDSCYSLGTSADQVCKTLRAYRENLCSSSKEDDPLSKEVEHELNLTLRALSRPKKAPSSPASNRSENRASPENTRTLALRPTISESTGTSSAKKPPLPRRT